MSGRSSGRSSGDYPGLRASPSAVALAGLMAAICVSQARAAVLDHRQELRAMEAAQVSEAAARADLEAELAEARGGAAQLEARRAALADANGAAEVPERWLSVSLDDRAVTLWEGGEPVFTAPVAVGMGNAEAAAAWAAAFSTPRGRRAVTARVADPIWIPPDWHYAEQSYATGLPVVAVAPGQPYEVGDGSTVEVRDGAVGIVRDGEFSAYAPGTDIVAGGAVIMPPIASSQRRYRAVLGAHMVEIGDGYAFHGTNAPATVGTASSHGCMRMLPDDIERLYDSVEVGDPVFIY
jgi:hypothetical protein